MAPPRCHGVIDETIDSRDRGPKLETWIVGQGVPPAGTDAWAAQVLARGEAKLTAAGAAPMAPPKVVKAWGRAILFTVPTAEETLWVKCSYRLPPGEELVLERLADRWPTAVPQVVACWEGAVAMKSFGDGTELQEDAPLEQWVATAALLGELAAGERAHVDDWLALGVRDRRPAQWPAAVEALVASPILDALDGSTRALLQQFLPDFIDRYIAGFTSAATLVHQDSGCCNVFVSSHGPVVFDWSDVVVGHPAFSCDRLLDQVPSEMQAAVIEAFIGPLELSAEEFRAMRRSNVLHEVLRYHDELAHLPADGETYGALAKSVCSQLNVLVDYEARRRDGALEGCR